MKKIHLPSIEVIEHRIATAMPKWCVSVVWKYKGGDIEPVVIVDVWYTTKNGKIKFHAADGFDKTLAFDREFDVAGAVVGCAIIHYWRTKRWQRENKSK